MPDDITITDGARQALRDALADADPGDVLHLTISPSFAHDLFIAAPEAADVVRSHNGISLHFDPQSAARAGGLRIDYVDNEQGGGFKIDNPNEPAKVRQLSPVALREMLDRAELVALFDVRTDAERSIAVIDGARHLDAEGEAYLLSLDRAAPIAFLCHHGVRSLAAAEHYARQGFTRLYNLQGGIDGWSVMVDSSVRRY